jgi:hypothetical protein
VAGSRWQENVLLQAATCSLKERAAPNCAALERNFRIA